MKPILFNAEMTKAILDGRKTVTRRVVKPCPISHLRHIEDGTKYGYWMDGNCQPFKPRYRPGDILYVRETWASNAQGGYFYKADGHNEVFTWQPSIHMPKEAARLFLRVTYVRVERLQEITVEGILQEGVSDIEPPPVCKNRPQFPDGFDKWSKERQDDWLRSTARGTYIGWLDYADNIMRAFKAIWDSTIKPADRDRYGWEANPWVWGIEFERITKEEATE